MTMVGMTVTDTWKIMKKNNATHSSITEFTDVFTHEMLDYTKDQS